MDNTFSRRMIRSFCILYTDKKKRKFSSYIRKFRGIECHLCSSSYIRKPFLVYDYIRFHLNFLLYDENVYATYICKNRNCCTLKNLYPHSKRCSSVLDTTFYVHCTVFLVLQLQDIFSTL
jgi:hypothetical protein